MKATEALLLIPGDCETAPANGNVVGIYPLAKDEGDEQGWQRPNRWEPSPRLCRKFTI